MDNFAFINVWLDGLGILVGVEEIRCKKLIIRHHHSIGVALNQVITVLQNIDQTNPKLSPRKLCLLD